MSKDFLVVARSGRHDTFLGWAKNRRAAKREAHGEFVCGNRGQLFSIFEPMAADFEIGTAWFHGHELPAFVLKV